MNARDVHEPAFHIHHTKVKTDTISGIQAMKAMDNFPFRTFHSKAKALPRLRIVCDSRA